jgi:hypothetical protein
MSRSRQKLAHRRARTARVRAAMHPSFTGTVFDVWRRAREIFLQFFDRHDTTIVALAERGYVFRAEHRKMSDWVHHLEVLVRWLILTAALAIKITLKPRDPKPRKAKRRLHIIWDNKPSTWVRLSFSIFPRASNAQRCYRAKPELPSRFARTLPLARRLETLRRILVAPEASARRAAFHLARLKTANRTSNQPRALVMDDAPPHKRAISRGQMAAESGLEKLMPLCEDRMDTWNRAPEPG